MSNHFKGYTYSLFFLVLSHLIFALLLAIPMYYSVLSQKSYEIISLVLSILFWIVAGNILGYYIYSKALLCALPIIIVYLFLAILLLFLTNSFTLGALGFVLLRVLLFGSAVRIGMNRK